MGMRHRIGWREFGGFCEGGGGFIESTGLFEGYAEVVVAGGVVGAEGDGLLDCGNGLIKFAAGAEEDSMIGVEGGVIGLGEDGAADEIEAFESAAAVEAEEA